MRLALALALFIGLGQPLTARAAEFRSVGVPVAILFDAPSQQARRIWLAPRQTPLEVLASAGAWVKVRDMSGDAAWIERAELSSQRTVVGRMLVQLRSTGQEGAEVLLQAERGVVFELLDPIPVSGWVRVRHRDGVSGWVRSAELWGL